MYVKIGGKRKVVYIDNTVSIEGQHNMSQERNGAKPINK